MKSLIFLVAMLDKWTVFCFQDNDKPSICDPDKYNKSNWTCDDYEVLLVANMGENLSETLKCTGYDVFKDPVRASGLIVPTQVNYAMKILKIESLNIDTSELVLEVEEMFAWNDSRLTWPEQCQSDLILAMIRLIKTENKDGLWYPKVERINIHKIMDLPEYKDSWPYVTRLWKNGSVAVHSRFMIHGFCQLSFKWFPFDLHHCELPFHSNQPSNEVQFGWDYSLLSLTNIEDLNLPDWDIDVHHGVELVNQERQDFNRSGIKIILEFTRVKSKHFLHTFIPSILLSIITVLAGIIPNNQTPERTTICVTTFLSMIALFGSAKDSWPDTSYMKAIDIWMVLCYIGVFYSLTECCLVIYVNENANGGAPCYVTPMIQVETKIKTGFNKKAMVRKVLEYAWPIAPLYNFLFMIMYLGICLFHPMPKT